jgi:hypothetical protein
MPGPPVARTIATPGWFINIDVASIDGFSIHWIQLKTGNPIVFAFHPSAQKCSAEAARIVRDAAIAAGASRVC